VPGPILMRLWEEQGREATEEAMTSIARFYFILVTPAMVGLSVLAAPVVQLLAEEAYYEGYKAVWLVAVSRMVFGIGQIGSVGILMANRTRLYARNQFISVGVNLTLNLLLVPPYGFMGAAASACIAFIFQTGLQMYSSSQFLAFRLPFRTMLHVVISSTLMALVVAALDAFGNHDTTLYQLITFLLAVTSGIAVYGLTLWAQGELSPGQIMRALSLGSSPSDMLTPPAQLAESEGE
jgi:O-antigen/teichoic acid export membrane protein